MSSRGTLHGITLLIGLAAYAYGDEPAKDKSVQEAAELTKQADGYRYAEDDKQNFSEAVRLYSKAAELGDAYAQCSLCLLYTSHALASMQFRAG